jgi:hypothetical protein
MQVNSETNHTGYLGTRNSQTVWLGRNDMTFSVQDGTALIAELTTVLAGTGLTPLQRAQYAIQLQWLQNGSVPQAEIIAQSMGLANPADNTNYLSMISGLMVSWFLSSIYCVD